MFISKIIKFYILGHTKHKEFLQKKENVGFKSGLYFGIIMGLFFALINMLTRNDGINGLLFGMVIGLVEGFLAGVIFGFLIHIFLRDKRKNLN